MVFSFMRWKTDAALSCRQLVNFVNSWSSLTDSNSTRHQKMLAKLSIEIPMRRLGIDRTPRGRILNRVLIESVYTVSTEGLSWNRIALAGSPCVLGCLDC